MVVLVTRYADVRLPQSPTHQQSTLAQTQHQHISKSLNTATDTALTRVGDFVDAVLDCVDDFVNVLVLRWGLC